MAFEIIMPAMEMAQETATLVMWLKAEGQSVRKGEPLMLIETDKVSVEIEAPASGTLSNLTARSGEEIPVGQVIGLILGENEMSAKSAVTENRLPEPPAKSKERIATPVAHRVAVEHNVDLSTVPSVSERIEKSDVLAFLQTQSNGSTGSPLPGKVHAASPKARRLAAEEGVALNEVRGTGDRGAVLAIDLQTIKRERRGELKEAAALSAGALGYRTIPLKGTRRVIADRMQASYQSAPHIALTLSVDMTEVRRLVEHSSPGIRAATGYPLTITAVLARVVGATLAKHPRLNAHVFENEIHEFSSVHLGIAVAIDDGLVVPVIRQIENKGFAAIQSELNDLGQRARSHTLKLDEIRGSTFTVSNLGMYGVEQFSAILNPPEAGILSIGKIKDTPIALGGQMVLRPVMQITLNANHRAVDGAVAAIFLQSLQRNLENPYLLLG